MIHLDRTRPHHLDPKAALILQNDPLPWSPLSHDDHQQQYLQDLADNSSKSLIQSSPTYTGPNTSNNTSHGPVTPVDGTDPALPGTSPSSPADPPEEASSSSNQLDQQDADSHKSMHETTQQTEDPPGALDNASRQSTPLSELSTAPEDDEPQRDEKQEEEEEEEEEEEQQDGALKHDGTAKSEKGPSADRDEVGPSSSSSAPAMETSTTGGNVDASVSKHPSPARETAASAPSSPSRNEDASAGASAQSKQQGSDAVEKTKTTPAIISTAAQGNSVPSVSRPSSQARQRTPSVQSREDLFTADRTSNHSSDAKVIAILQLNSELLRVYMEFTTRGFRLTEKPCTDYSLRLESNLRWLAAAHDQTSKASTSVVPLPAMEAPPSVDFTSMDRIHHLYRQLPIVFARDIARSQGRTIPQLPSRNHHSTPSSTSPPGLKRDRTEDGTPSVDPASKRRDTGERKATPSALNIAPQFPGGGLPTNNAAVPGQRNPYANQRPGAHAAVPPSAGSPPDSHALGHPSQSHSQLGTPVMQPPSIRPSVSPTANMDPQRVRQMQMFRQAIHQQQQQQQPQSQQHQQQQHQHPSGNASGSGSHQMSPAPGSSQQHAQPMPNMSSSQQNMSVPNPGPSNNMSHVNIAPSTSAPMNPVGPNNLTAGQIQALSAFGPNALQNYQILQNPTHPMMQYLIQMIPGFMSMPLQQQLSRMQTLQMLARQNQQNQQASAAQRSASFGQVPSGMPSMQQQQQQQPQGGNMPNPAQLLAANAMNAMSHQSAMVPQQMHGQASQGGAYPPNPSNMQNNINAGAGPSGMAQQPNLTGLNLQSLTPEQRQFLYLQQQQRMRGNNNNNTNMSPANSQLYQAAQAAMRQQQQGQGQGQGQAGSPPQVPNMGSSMPGPSHGGEGSSQQSYAALRSNPASAIPGIARSTRSPSDSAPSPREMRAPSAQQMHPQSQSQEEYHRAMVQAQHAAARSGFVNPQQLGIGNWGQQTNMGQAGSYGMASSGGGGQGGPSPTAGNQPQNWSQGVPGHYPFAGSPAGGGQQLQHHMEQSPSRATSSTPIPMSTSQQYQQHQQNSPSSNQPGGDSFDLFNWG